MLSTRRILVVDDDPTLRETLGEVLSDEGYEVRLAHHGAEALDLLEGWRADLVILDLMMPVMDAYAFRAAERERGGAISPVIILSALPVLEAAQFELGAVAVVAKPFALKHLLSVIAEHLPPPGGGLANGPENPHPAEAPNGA